MKAIAMRLEGHDNEIGNLVGTLAARLKVPVDYAYQVEMHVQEWTERFRHVRLRRLYAFDDNTVHCVWGCDEQNVIHYVGRDENYDGEWQLPLLNPEVTDIATAVIGREVKDFDDAVQWAEKALRGNIATAVAIDKDGIFAAWEKGPEGPILMTKGTRPFPAYKVG